MSVVRRRSARGWILAALLVGGPAGALAGTEPPPFPAEPAQLARAEALSTLPCSSDAAGGASSDAGFTVEPGVEPVWRVAGTIVAVRRAGADRFAFVLEPTTTAHETCRVQQVVVLPRHGVIMQCALPDASSSGIGVHAQSATGRRDTVYWASEPNGRLHRPARDAMGVEIDTDELICSLPE